MKSSRVMLSSVAGLALASTLVAFAAAPASETLAQGTSAAAASASIAEAEAKSFEIDGSHSAVLFRVKHLNVANFWGRFNTVSGVYTLDASDPAGSSIEIEIDVNSVDSNHDGRDRHLKSPDFFNTAQFPTATFASTSVVAGEGDTLDVRGNLTIRGETQPVSFALTPTGEGDRGPRFGYRSGWETELTISRSAFGVNYLPEGLGDEVKLVIAIEGIAK